MAYTNNLYDTIIIGSGPAGVTAAYTLVRKKKNVLLIEKGKDPLRRRDLISGWFGRGLFSLNRLKLSDPMLNNKKMFSEALNFLNKICEIGNDLDDKPYVKLPSGYGREVAAYFYEILTSKSNVIFNTEVQYITTESNSVGVKTDKGLFKANNCIIATGRYSIEWINKVCELLNITTEDTGAKVGICIEMPTTLAIKKIDVEKDSTTPSGAECEDVCTNAFVGEWEESGMLSAIGCNLPEKRSDKTSFMLSWKPDNKVEEIVRTIKIANVLANDKVKKERVKDFIEEKSVLQHLDMFDYLKEAFVELNDVFPAFINYASMYVPEVKLFGTLPVNAKMKTPVCRIYGAGECTTKASTIIGAVASGLIVSRTILGE